MSEKIVHGETTKLGFLSQIDRPRMLLYANYEAKSGKHSSSIVRLYIYIYIYTYIYVYIYIYI